MKTGKNIIWGIVLVVIGVILILNAVNIIDYDFFFDGWWTLFIIVPSALGLITDDNKSGSIIFLSIGVLLLLACQKVIDFSLVARLVFPIIIVVIGLSLLLRNMLKDKISKSIESINASTKAQEEYNAIFSGQDIKLDDKEFDGTIVNAIFGGIKLDLRKAIIKKDVVITGKAIFGGIDIYTPDDVNVEIKSNSVFGGVDNKNKNSDNKVTIFIDATCVFGGIDIK